MKIPEMDECQKWSTASFRVSGDLLDPEKVGERLGLEATVMGSKGEPKSLRNKNMWRNKSLWRSSIWLLKCPLSNKLPVDDHLKWLLDRLEPKQDEVFSLAQQFRIDFFCGFSSGNGQGGFTLDSILLARLAKLGIPLILDLYPPETELDIEPQTA